MKKSQFSEEQIVRRFMSMTRACVRGHLSRVGNQRRFLRRNSPSSSSLAFPAGRFFGSSVKAARERAVREALTDGSACSTAEFEDEGRCHRCANSSGVR